MKRPSSSSIKVINFLGSMNLAITLLVVLAIASVIGTVLKQNQPYPDYEIKFGKFWFEFFRLLGLYDVYSAVWFLLILAFLVISTTICISRNTPGILRELRHFRENVQEKSLRAMKNQLFLTTPLGSSKTLALAQRILQAQGFKLRQKSTPEHTVLAGMKGRFNHLGYWLTHVGIIVICLGGLLDSRLPLMIAEWRGNIKPETSNIPAAEVPAISQLPPNSFSYRGSVDIPEGSHANIIFLPVRDGYLVQHLPFEIEVKDFRVEHYSTGQPKSFESDVVIRDNNLKKPLKATISVNHPLVYKGTAIYQASFGDGGSEVKLHLLPFNSHYAAQDLTGNIFSNYDLSSSREKYRMELNDFRLFNINDMEQEDGSIKKKNIGPSVTFKLRDVTGQAMEYQNYMNPVNIKGQNYLISGVRASPAEPFRYLHIPLDPKGGSGRFMQFLDNLQNADFVKKTALETTRNSMREAKLKNPEIEQQVVESMARLTYLFATSGFEGVSKDIASKFPENKRAAANEAFMKVLNASLRAVYEATLKQEGVTKPTDNDWDFYDDSLSAIANLPFYGSPWYIQMTGFKQIEASGLQITRSPGKNVVYLGSAMLIVGVFLLFYVAHRRIWVRVKTLDDGDAEIILAGSSNRHQPEFQRYFERLQHTFQQAVTEEVKHVSSTGNA